MATKLKPEPKTFVNHPLTTAILEKNLSSFVDLMAEHLESLKNIAAFFPNEGKENRCVIFIQGDCETFWVKLFSGKGCLCVFCLHRQPTSTNRYMQFLPEQGFRLESPLETATRIGWLKGVELLLDHGVSPRHEKRIAFHDPPCALLWACYKGYADVVKVLLEKGADVDCLHERMLNCSFFYC